MRPIAPFFSTRPQIWPFLLSKIGRFDHFVLRNPISMAIFEVKKDQDLNILHFFILTIYRSIQKYQKLKMTFFPPMSHCAIVELTKEVSNINKSHDLN